MAYRFTLGESQLTFCDADTKLEWTIDANMVMSQQFVESNCYKSENVYLEKYKGVSGYSGISGYSGVDDYIRPGWASNEVWGELGISGYSGLNGTDILLEKGKITYSNAELFITNLNNSNYGGYSDWKIPSLYDFWSIMDFVEIPTLKPNIYIEIHHVFPGFLGVVNLREAFYWTSNIINVDDLQGIGVTFNRLCVNFGNMTVVPFKEISKAHVWAVREIL